MSIRWRLLFLLLAIAVVPLVCTSWIQNRSLRRLGRDVGSGTREALIERAGHQLLQLVDDYATMLDRETETLAQVLRFQAREAERCLAADPPAAAEIFWAEDYDRGERLPRGMVESPRHLRRGDGGGRMPVAVTYEQQVFKLAPGVERGAVMDDVARLSRMVAGYRLGGQGHPSLIHWQYTALASGVHSSYPGHGGYPADFDPRARSWYLNAVEAGDLTWSPPMVDASTGDITLAVSMPIRRADGSVAGVTGIDVQLLEVVHGIKVPFAWSPQAQILLVMPAQRLSAGDRGLAVLAQRSYLEGEREWNVPIELARIEPEDAPQVAGLVADILAGRPGLHTMEHAGQHCLWVNGPAGDQTALLLIVPYQEIVAQAAAAERNVLERTHAQLQTTGLALLVVLTTVVVIALLSSRTVTRPVAELAAAARRIAAGDFAARAQITGRNELGELGRTFNKMVPQLAERLSLRHSLSLAMEVQQRLLPAGPPRIPGLDLAGTSIYCDETGGDYYDFVDLSRLSPGCLGVAVGDVTGHGIAAALLMATARAMLRSRAGRSGHLARIISEINNQLCDDTGGDRFMTLVYMVLDVPRRSVRWLCAGHDPPITYDPQTGRFDELGSGGIPLGVDADWPYQEFEAVSPPGGWIIVIGTDGIWETRNPAGEMFGKQRLRRIVADHAGRTAEQISARITSAVAAFRETRGQEDDVTLVVVKILPADEAGRAPAGSPG